MSFRKSLWQKCASTIVAARVTPISVCQPLDGKDTVLFIVLVLLPSDNRQHVTMRKNHHRSLAKLFFLFFHPPADGEK